MRLSESSVCLDRTDDKPVQEVPPPRRGRARLTTDKVGDTRGKLGEEHFKLPGYQPSSHQHMRERDGSAPGSCQAIRLHVTVREIASAAAAQKMDRPRSRPLSAFDGGSASSAPTLARPAGTRRVAYEMVAA